MKPLKKPISLSTGLLRSSAPRNDSNEDFFRGFKFQIALALILSLSLNLSLLLPSISFGQPASAFPGTTEGLGGKRTTGKGGPSGTIIPEIPEEALRSVTPPADKTPPEDSGALAAEIPSVPAGTGEAPPAAGVEGVTVKTDVTSRLTDEETVYLNVQEADIKDVIKQISKATGRNFIIDDKIKGKVTIISERPMTREEAYQTFLSALEVAGYTTVKGPAGVIKIVGLKDASRAPIPTHVDSTPYTDGFITRLIALENISALEMSNAIKDLISKDGNLFAYTATNTLIITDSGSNIDRLMKIVKELDQEGPQQVMEIIPIKNTEAKKVVEMIKELFQKDQAAAKGAARKGRGAEAEEMAEVSQITADERTNSIIVMASKRAIEKVRMIIAKLDSRLGPEQEGGIHVYFLQHGNAKKMAEVLNPVISGATKGKGAEAGASQIEGIQSVVADETMNALIITANPKAYRTLVAKVISKLDVPRRQVYFESVIMEMRLTKGAQYGVSGYGGAGGGSVIGFGETMGSPSLLGGIIGSAATGGTSAWPALLGGLISSRTTNITYVGADGTSSTLTVPAFSAFLTALASQGEANVVSTPNLLTLDGEEATMNVTTKEPIPGDTTYGASGITTGSSVRYEEAGLELKIKPQITEGNMVRLEIDQKLSGFTTATYNTTIGAPAERQRSIKTIVVTMDGETVVLAGLMDDVASKDKRKIPVLGDIPILGFLFSTTTTAMSKSNLLIFITPHVIRDATDFSSVLKRKIEERNRFIDDNFSKSRRRQIRDTIKFHNEDLLEFREPIHIEAAKDAAGKAMEKPPEVETRPVVTVPPKGVSSRGAAVPVTPITEPEVWKPVVPVSDYPKTVVKPAPRYEEPSVVIPPPAPKLKPKPVVPSIEEKSIEDKPAEVSKWQPVEPMIAPPPPPPPPLSAPVEPPVSEKVEKKKAKEELKKEEGKQGAASIAPWISPVPEGKKYKKPVIPTPAFEKEETVPEPAPVQPPPAPAPKAKEEAKEGEKVEAKAEAKVPEAAPPVITVPQKPAEKKVWKKPVPGGPGEIDIAY